MELRFKSLLPCVSYRQWGSDAPVKGSATAIAEAYRKQKEAEKKVVLLRSQKGEKSGADKVGLNYILDCILKSHVVMFLSVVRTTEAM